MKNAIIKIVITIFPLILLGGCTQNNDKKHVNYVETNIALPDETLRIYDMVENENGNFTILTESQTQSGCLYELNKNEKKWKKTNNEWEGLENSAILDAKFWKENTYYTSLLYNSLLAATEEEFNALNPKYFIAFYDGSNKEIELDLSKGDGLVDDNYFTVLCKKEDSLVGIDNANIIYSFSKEGQLNYANSEVKNLQANILKIVEVKDIIYVILNNEKMYCMDTNTGRKIKGNKNIIDFLSYTENNRGVYEIFVDNDQNKIYKLDSKKIFCYDLEHETNKEILELQYFDLRNGIQFQMFVGKDDTLYISYTLGDGTIKLNQYKYMEKGIEVEKQALTIYSLTENYKLECLVDAFKIKYPDQPIEIIYGYTNEDGKTKSDAIQSLNTELLAGNGTDLIIMDGLSVDTYYEEGLLKSLNGIIDMETVRNELFVNMLSPYEDNNVQFAIPGGFHMYGIVGKPDYVDVFEDIDRLLTITEGAKLDFAIPSYHLSETANIIYLSRIQDCFLDSGELDNEKLMQMFVELERLYKLSGNPFTETNDSENIFEGGEDYSMNAAIEWIYYSDLPYVIAPFTNTESFFATNYITAEKVYTQKYLLDNEKLVFNNQIVMAMNAQSSNTEDVKTFIEFVLKEGQETLAQTLLTLPVNKNTLKGLLMDQDKQEPFQLTEFSWEGDLEVTKVMGLGLNSEDYKFLSKEIESGVKFDYGDALLKEAIMEEASNYCLDKKTLDNSVNDAAKKVLVYNKE
ncbi:MAG: hypothetical protein ACRC3H_05330 [Lachnospiraceae bacterium]